MERIDRGAGCHLLEYSNVDEACQMAATCTELHMQSEIATRLRVAAFLQKIGIYNWKDRKSLGFEPEWPWRYIASIYARCAVWLRADAEYIQCDSEQRILEWRDCLGSEAVARPLIAREAPILSYAQTHYESNEDSEEMPLRNRNFPVVDYATQRVGRGLVLRSIPTVRAGAMLVIASVSGDSTIIDGAANDRFELCHGYPTDGNRAQPRICFTASNTGDPPKRGLWGTTRATGRRHAYTIFFGHKSWRRQTRPSRVPYTFSSAAAAAATASNLQDVSSSIQEGELNHQENQSLEHTFQPPPPPRRGLRLLSRSNSLLGGATDTLRRSGPLASLFGRRQRQQNLLPPTTQGGGLDDVDDNEEILDIQFDTESPQPPTRGSGPPFSPETQQRSAALFVDSTIQGCADVGANLIDNGLTLGSDRNGSYRLRGDLSVFALWNGPVPASCLFALERHLIHQHDITHPPESSLAADSTTRPRADTA